MNGKLTHPGKVLLSIDFEDFSHDLKRDLGLWQTGPLRVDALWQAYDIINNFFCKNAAAKGTFFCTGVIADQAPDLIQQIADDGHEIACHHYFHDNLDSLPLSDVENGFLRAKEALQKASGQKIIGFRAPKFRIDQGSDAQYQLVERHFEYDSSHCANAIEDAEEFRKRMKLKNLKTLPIFHGRPVWFGPRIKLGGSFLKLFPSSYTDAALKSCFESGMQPHLYLHPYEFVADRSFRLVKDDLAPLSVKARAYWRVRQDQWLRFGNRGLITKLQNIAARYGVIGRLDEYLRSVQPPLNKWE